MITKKTKFSISELQRGEIILVDKPKTWTSFNVVNKIKHSFGIRKVGHSGTLDPAATGLLIIGTGKKTKELTFLQNLGKTYSGEFTLGKRTKSMDAETEFFEEKSIDFVTDEMIEETRKSFLGTSNQIPPMYSAIKHKGKSLYKYARKGEVIERQPREITISKFEITEINLPVISFITEVTKGTYIRVLADDFGNKLGCGAYLSYLRREKIGEYSVEDAFTIDELSEFIEESKN